MRAATAFRPGRAVGLVVVLFVINGVGNAVFSPFAPAILVGRGISATWVGIMSAVVSLVYVGLAGAWGHLADVVLGRGRALALALAIGAGLLGLFALPLPLPLVAATYVSFATVYGLMFPLQDALAVNALANPERQYGPVRALQSGSYAVAALAAGAIFDASGFDAAVPAFLVLAIPAMVVALGLPDAPRARLAGRGRGGAVREALAIQPRLPRVLASIGLANVGVFAGLTFLPLLVVRLGGSPGDIGLVVGLTAATEVVALPVVSRLLAARGPAPVVTAGFALLAAVFAWFALAPTPVLLIAVTPLYGLAWSAMWAGSVTTVRVLLPPTLQGSGQSLLALTTAGAASFAANVGGGILWAGPGPGAVFGLAACCALAGVAVGWSSLPRKGELAVAVDRQEAAEVEVGA